ncbi:4-coumarate--CoA ligase 1-like isoform X2 [Cephus cinctus]|uniref:Luciferin 4-monooxygenase n=1 Tax=Cephus cinctus TaxID=211228 RepID=A0AAJ7FV73_CEPCN|nr:4-coumarate--CoA ligase 1-like isoform X2 [Cephus cinctus]
MVDADSGMEQSFEQILNASRKLAIYLNNCGLIQGDCITVCGENSLNFCIPVLTAIYLGVTTAPLNPLYSDREFLHALNISKPKYIFVSPLVAERMKGVAINLSWSPKLILLTDFPDINLPSMSQLISSIPDSNLNRFRVQKVNIETHVVVILCSSGTTGLPKGVMLTDKNIITVINHLSDPSFGSLTKNVITLGLLPFFHAYSFITMIVKLAIGVKTIVLSRFEDENFLEAIQKYKIQHLSVVPPLMVFLAKHPLIDRYDLSSVKHIWCGAAPLSKEIQTAVMKRLNVSKIRQGYGLTETTLAVIISPENNKPGSIGTLAPGVQAKVISIGENEPVVNLGPNRQGELCFKGDVIMKGYCGDISSTDATIDKNGWLHTGDVGYYDNDGYFYIVDRLKELIKYKGFQVPPAELEAILLTHPRIKDAAVIGVPNEEAGELPLAFVVKQVGSEVKAEEIIQYVNERVSVQKRLRGGVRFLDNIPKTASGKILRRELRNILKSKL